MCNGSSSTQVKSTSTSAPTAPPTITAPPPEDVHSNGVERQQRLIEAGLLFLSVVYGTIQWLDLPIDASPQYCNDRAGGSCRRSDLLAYKVASGLAMCCMGGMGFYNWYRNPELQEQSHSKSKSTSKSSSTLLSTPEQRIFGYSKVAEYQNVAILCYQVWDFIVSWTIPEHVEAIFLIHHVLAGFIAYGSLRYQVFGYYSIYYGGCSEVSSIFLVLSDIDEMFPLSSTVSESSWQSNLYYGIIFASKLLFVVTFTYYRVIGWIFTTGIPLWKDTIYILKSNRVEQYRPGTTWLLISFLVLSALLGALQLYWLGHIVEQVRQVLMT